VNEDTIPQMRDRIRVFFGETRMSQRLQEVLTLLGGETSAA
jgi:hypothetical protein